MNISVELKVSEICCAIGINAFVEGLPAFKVGLLPKRGCTHISIFAESLLIIPLFVSKDFSKLLMTPIVYIFAVPIFLGFISFCSDPFVSWPELTCKIRLFWCIFSSWLSEALEGERIGHLEFSKRNVIYFEGAPIFVVHYAVITTKLMDVSMVQVTLILEILYYCLFLGDNFRKVCDLICQKL
jgi:hypothetical protein